MLVSPPRSTDPHKNFLDKTSQAVFLSSHSRTRKSLKLCKKPQRLKKDKSKQVKKKGGEGLEETDYTEKIKKTLWDEDRQGKKSTLWTKESTEAESLTVEPKKKAEHQWQVSLQEVDQRTERKHRFCCQQRRESHAETVKKISTKT